MMRANDLNGGSIKALLILVLLFANAALAQFRHPERSAAQSRDLVKLNAQAAPRDPSTALGMTAVKEAP